MFKKILIANRGEIACRIIKTAHAMGIQTVAVYSDADAHALHVEQASEAVHIGPAPAIDSYLCGSRIINAANETGAEAIHPGYGFLSENAEFADAVARAGLTFIGPSADAIRKMGLKDAAKKLMEDAGVPVVPGYHGSNQDLEHLAIEATKIGYPILIKARAGGGGKGMRKVDDPNDFSSALKSAQREGQASFNDPHVLIEKYISAPRHIEVQVFGDTHGNVIHLFERDCSLQRRHQKVIEEAPAPGMTEDVRAAMTEAAITAAKAIDYTGAGTVEFIVDGSGPLRPDGFWFMEMNTRLQVEHPVTEAITGHDLVAWQLRIAAGEPLPETQDQQKIKGHAFEARIYAEDVPGGFLPATGTLEHLKFAAEARADTGVRRGDAITPWYDPMIAKVIAAGDTRDDALARLRSALANTHIAGTVTNIAFLSALCNHCTFSSGTVDTGLIERDLTALTAVKDVPEEAIAFAILASLNLDLSHERTGWRLWGHARHRIKLMVNGRTIERHFILEGRDTVFFPTQDLRLENISIAEGRCSADIGNRHITTDVATYRSGQGHPSISLLFDGTAWEIHIPDPLSGRENSASDPNAVRAPMTGIIRTVDAVPEKAVKKGESLAVLEAMKMEHKLTAPRDGTIASISCRVGDQVAGGSTLITLEPDDNP